MYCGRYVCDLVKIEKTTNEIITTKLKQFKDIHIIMYLMYSAKDYYEYRIAIFIFLQYYMLWLGVPSLIILNINPLCLLYVIYYYNDKFKTSLNIEEINIRQPCEKNAVTFEKEVEEIDDWEVTQIDESNNKYFIPIPIPIQYQPFLQETKTYDSDSCSSSDNGGDVDK